jgi:catechol-2,3-dioxygenase
MGLVGPTPGGRKNQMTSSIHPDTRLGYVHLTVRDLKRSLSFYQNVLGFKLHQQNDGTARLAPAARICSS